MYLKLAGKQKQMKINGNVVSQQLEMCKKFTLSTFRPCILCKPLQFIFFKIIKNIFTWNQKLIYDETHLSNAFCYK